LIGTFPNTLLPDIHQIASGVGTTVAIFRDLSNGKSQVAYPTGGTAGR
jgi:hypothetical protein